MSTMRTEGGSETFDARLRDLTDRERATAAAETRRREHWLREQAAEEGTLLGVLLDLAEREQPLRLSTVSGRSLAGVVRTVGADFVGLRGPGGEGALVPLRSITAIRPEPGTSPTVGDRVIVIASSLRAVLHDLATERPWVSLRTTAGEVLSGALRTVGEDVVSLRTGSGETIYAPLSTVADVVLT